ncbi:MAG: metal ABC transporter permease [Clostridia bacterium]|nr:metal ABC transporter permease [Clostridia bacterium]
MELSAIFASEFLTRVVLRAMVVGVLVSLCASVLGVSLVLKRYSMIGDGLSHVGFFALSLSAAAGVSATYSMEVSVPVVILAAVLILRLSRRDGRLNGDAACAIVSTGAVAVGTLMYNFTGGRSGDICNSLFGSASVITISDKDMVLSIILSAVVLVWFVLFSKTIFSVTFDETFAHAAGIRTDVYSVLLAVLTGVTIVVGMKMMGSIMISALIIFPALTAMRLTKSFRLTVILSAVISVVCFVAGFLAACVYSLQTGAAVVTAELVCFVLVSAVSAAVSEFRRRARGRS